MLFHAISDRFGQYTYLLLSLVMSLILFSMFSGDGIGRLFLHLWMFIMIAVMILSLKTDRYHRFCVYALASITVLFAVLSFVFNSLGASGVLYFLYVYMFPFAVLFVFFCAWTIVHSVFGRKQITADILSGAIVAYILMGIACGGVYSYIEFLQPGSFDFGKELLLTEKSSALFYYSFVTLTTLGFGDILPLSELVRTITYLESIFGVMYSAIIVAFLVSNFQREAK